MFNLFKKTTLDCVTNRKDVLDISPIQKSSMFVPEWFKQMDSSYELDGRESSTIKRCDAVRNLIHTGFVLPMWTDLKITVTENEGYSWHFGDKVSELTWHHSEQWDKFYDGKKYYHVKLLSPYKFVCNNNTQFYCTPHELFKHEQIDVVSGITEFKIQHATHINFFVERKNQDIFIPHGFPIYKFIPMTEKKVSINNKLITTDQFNQLELPRVKFKGNYSYIKKCPFHKG